MITLQCPRCGFEQEAAELAVPPPPCPRCGASLAGNTVPPVRPPGPDDASETGRGPPLGVLSAIETTVPDVPTRVNVPAERFSFLSPPHEPDELGWLGPYRVLKVLGRGGMGVVFEAEDSHLQRRVALKVMRPDEARDREPRIRFLREARLAASVRSDHVVAIHQVGQCNEVPFLATELLQGETLATWLQRGARASPGQVLDLALQLTRGLAAAHEKGLIHRDIKPANVWLEAPSGRVKVLDFGLARPQKDLVHLTQTGMVMGTPAYMAPEQAEGGQIDARADLFSLGCVLYEVATGVQPFDGSGSFAILQALALRDPRPPHELAPALPRELSALILRLLAKKPAGRPASASAVVEELEAIAAAHPEVRLTSLSGPQPKAAPAPSGPRRKAADTARRPRRRILWAAGLTGLAGALLLAIFLGRWLLSRPAAAPPPAQGVEGGEIRFGMSGPFNGPTSELGRSMKAGILTCFDHVNDQGGVAGRKLRLIALDDGYEPKLALANVRELDEKYKVFGYVGNVGTPTAEKTLPYALDKKLLFFGALSGAGLLRESPPARYVFNFRPCLEEETGDAVRYLVEVRKIKPEQIAVFAQQDGYGNAGFRGAVRALRKYGRAPAQVLRVGYVRNTGHVEPAVKEVLRHKEVRAVVMVPTYRPAARFIHQLENAGRGLIYTSTAFVDAEMLAQELRQMGVALDDRLLVTQVVPPVRSQSSAILKYQELAHRYQPNEPLNSISLEGYLAASVLVEGLKRAGDNPTTERLVEALESIHDLDLGIGVKLSYGLSDHQASHKLWGLLLDRSGQYRPVELE
jgi:ABC-type branched-subunit amino acid transport system substrate-binding protein